MTNFSQTEQSTLIAVMAGALMVAAMFAIIFNQQRKINQLEMQMKPKYGFLGKPLVAITLALLGVGGIGLTYYASNNIQNVVVNADINVEIAITTEQIGLSQVGRQNVKFSMIPTVDGFEWGTNGDTFEVFWNITGPETITQLELGLHSKMTSGFIRLIKPGQYEINVDVIYKNKRFTKTQQLVVTLQ